VSGFRSIWEISAAEWRAALGMQPEETIDAVIVEGSWWRAQRTAWRLAALEAPHELAFPDIFAGQLGNRTVVYCCAYGAPRTVEIIHLCGMLGAQAAIQIGTCGGLQPHLQPGDIILPQTAACRDGVAHLYAPEGIAHSSEQMLLMAASLLRERGHTTHPGPHLTWSAIFAQDGPMVEGWHREGFLSVDMETATTYAVSNRFGMATVSMLVVWDDLMRGRSFLDPLSPQEQERLDRGNADVYTVALDLIARLSPRTSPA